MLSCLNAKLIEVNQRIVERPDLLALEGDGYVAVGLPKIENIDSIKEKLLTEEQYRALNEDAINIINEQTENKKMITLIDEM